MYDRTKKWLYDKRNIPNLGFEPKHRFLPQNPETIAEIVVPEDVHLISLDLIRLFENLESIVVESENSEYLSLDGALFDKNTSSIIYYPPNKKDDTYDVPGCVLSIDSKLFDENSS